MIVRIYGLMWLLVAAVASILYFTDSFTFAATMILGFITSVLMGAGIFAVYPALLNERVSSLRKAPQGAARKNLAASKLQRAG